jgi:hypothetical protein
MRRNFVRSALTVGGTMVLVLVMTCVWSILVFLDEATAEKSKNLKAIDPAKAETITTEAGKAALRSANKAGQFDALAKMAFFPAFMLVCYVALFVYFKSQGGYTAQVLVGHEAKDKKFTGGVPAAVE